jgi:hypothetical protein
MSATEEFQIVNQWLGWGEPNEGIWFIGVEEAFGWECKSQEELVSSRQKIRAMKDMRYSECSDKSTRGNVNWPVAVGTAKIASIAKGNDISDWRKYREEELWLPGCKVFNGNLLSLGKPSLAHDLPQGFVELFGFGENDYGRYYEQVKQDRFEAFRLFRNEHRPRAIVCFGMSHWIQFKELFAIVDEKATIESELQTQVYENNRVILTRHFSNGMSDQTIEFIGKKIALWTLHQQQRDAVNG